MSGGQAEAARAARIVLGHSAATGLHVETAREGEPHDGGDFKNHVRPQGGDGGCLWKDSEVAMDFPH